jgi:RimJ/RimL family protein N-acetyltransferase
MSGNKLQIESCEEKYYKFMYDTRFHPEIKKGFITQEAVSFEEHCKYLDKYKNNYYICIDENKPIGYIGVIDDDIRFAVSSEYQGFGVGTFMLDYIKNKYPKARGKIFDWNISSQKVFEKVGIPYNVI